MTPDRLAPVQIEVNTNPPRVVVNGLIILTAPTVAEMYAVLGSPRRIYDGPVPAPVTHRNSRRHIYDDLGIEFLEHHYTQRVTALTCSFQTGDPVFTFTPRTDFAGRLTFDGKLMPLAPSWNAFANACPWPIDRVIGRLWCHRFEGFSVYVDARGKKLPSKHRSKARDVTYIAIGWPHDDWGEPVPNDKQDVDLIR